MAEQTLYDILEVTETASHEAIRGAYQRLAALYDPASPHRLAVPDATLRFTAIREAFHIVGNRHRRAEYDRKLKVRFTPPILKSFWTFPKLALIGVLTTTGVGCYNVYADKQDAARLASTRAMEIARAEQEQLAEAEERARIQRVKMHTRAVDERQKREKDASRMQLADNRALTESQRVDFDRAAAQQRARRAQAAVAERVRAASAHGEACRFDRDGLPLPC